MGAQEASAETVKGAKERRLGVTRELALLELQKARADALGELAGGALGECDGEDARRRDAVVECSANEALDEHRGLARAGASGEQQRALAARHSLLLLVGESALGTVSLVGASRLGQEDLKLCIHRSERQMEG